MHGWDNEDPLGRYRLERPLATTGTENVWLAEDVRLHRRVVVTESFPCARGGEEISAARARRSVEALRAAQLMSGRIETVYDVVEGVDAIYVVTEFIDAPTLADRVRDGGPLSVLQATSMARQLVQALHYAHSRDVIHGSVNPCNVRVFDDGSVKLAGFARSSTDSVPVTEFDAGAYRAPELSDHASPNPATDLWSLGATLRYALYGAASSVQARGAKIRRADSADAVSLRGVLADLLNEDPAKRPNAIELAHILEASTVAAPRRPALNAKQSPPQPLIPQVQVAPTQPPRVARRRSARGLISSHLLVIASALVLFVGAGMTYALRPSDDTNSLRRIPERTTIAAAATSAPVTNQPTTAVALTVAPTIPSTTTGSSTTAAASTSSTTIASRPPTTTAPSPPTTSGSSATPPTIAPSPPAAGLASGVPLGWVMYRDEATGYRIARPQNWTVRPVTSYRTDFIEPLTGAFVRIEWTDEPGSDPVTAWRNQAQNFALRQTGYQELRIEPTIFKGHNAAEWEFRSLDKGIVRHALDIGMVTGRYGAALFATAPEARWQSLQTTLDTFRATFEPPI